MTQAIFLFTVNHFHDIPNGTGIDSSTLELGWNLIGGADKEKYTCECHGDIWVT
jgi:hypothetical protein